MLLNNFSQQLIRNERYSNWFPKREQTHHYLRNDKTYKEIYARTKRLYDSPLFAIRRLINEEQRGGEEKHEGA